LAISYNLTAVEIQVRHLDSAGTKPFAFTAAAAEQVAHLYSCPPPLVHGTAALLLSTIYYSAAVEQ
jgi:hypothetical protein